MKVYFLRHGPAAEPEVWPEEDFTRPLTTDGAERIRLEAETLRIAGISFDAIISSPLVRAVQTAELMSRTLGCCDPVALDPRLGPGFDAELLSAIMKDHQSLEAILLVGHEPNMSAVLGECMGGGRIELKKGSLACLEFRGAEDRKALLRFLLPPALFAGQLGKP